MYVYATDFMYVINFINKLITFKYVTYKLLDTMKVIRRTFVTSESKLTENLNNFCHLN